MRESARKIMVVNDDDHSACRILLPSIVVGIPVGRLIARHALSRGSTSRKDHVEMTRVVLKLYVAGRTSRTEQAISAMKEICESDLSNAYDLAVIDVLEWPQLAENEKILATPTVVKELPPPLRRVVGDLSNRERVLVGLDLVRPVPVEPKVTPR